MRAMLRAACWIARRTIGPARSAPRAISDRETSSGGDAPSKRRANSTSARSPLRSTRSTIARTRRSNARSLPRVRDVNRLIAARLLALMILTARSCSTDTRRSPGRAPL
jgi:hypothetical protein